MPSLGHDLGRLGAKGQCLDSANAGRFFASNVHLQSLSSAHPPIPSFTRTSALSFVPNSLPSHLLPPQLSTELTSFSFAGAPSIGHPFASWYFHRQHPRPATPFYHGKSQPPLDTPSICVYTSLAPTSSLPYDQMDLLPIRCTSVTCIPIAFNSILCVSYVTWFSVMSRFMYPHPFYPTTVY